MIILADYCPGVTNHQSNHLMVEVTWEVRNTLIKRPSADRTSQKGALHFHVTLQPIGKNIDIYSKIQLVHFGWETTKEQINGAKKY